MTEHSFTVTEHTADYALLECSRCQYRTSDIEWENWPDNHPACQPLATEPRCQCPIHQPTTDPEHAEAARRSTMPPS